MGYDSNDRPICGSFSTRMLLNGKNMILATRIWMPTSFLSWTETNLSDALSYLLVPSTTSTTTRVTELQTTASCKCLWYGLILFSILERLFLTHLQCYFITVFCKLSLQWVSEAYILKPKENVKTVDCKNSVNALILKKYLHVSTAFIALAESSQVMKFLHFLERLHGKMEFKFTRPE